MASPASALRDNFNVKDTVKWGWYRPLDATVNSNGQLQIYPVNNYPAITSANGYELSDSYLCAELVQHTERGATELAMRIDQDNGLRFVIFPNGTLEMIEMDGGVADRVTIPYSPLGHRWLRFRGTGGRTINWETSPDGVNWRVRRTKDTTLIDNVRGSLKCNINAGGGGNPAIGRPALWDNVNYNGGTVIDTSVDKTEALVDAFDGVTAWWGGYSTSMTLGGALTIQPVNTSDAPLLASVNPMDMTDSYIAHQLVSNFPAGRGSYLTTIGARVSAGNQVSWQIEGGTVGKYMFAQQTVGGVTDQLPILYDPSKHKWFRIRESAGVVYWETSVDSSYWIVRHQLPRRIDLSSISVFIEANHYQNETVNGSVVIDNFNNILGTVVGPEIFPKTTTLVDTFDSERAEWEPWGSGISVTNGQLKLDATDTYPTLATSSFYDMTDSHVAFQLAQNAAAGNGTFTTGMIVFVDPDNQLKFSIDGGDGGYIICSQTVAGVSTDVPFLMNPLRHKWFRIRESGGTLTWETSIDSRTWVIRATMATGISLTQVRVQFTAGKYGTETITTSSYIDNFNQIIDTLIGVDEPLKMELLQDNFSTQNAAKWFGYDGVDVTTQANQLKLVPTSAYVYLNGMEAWDLTDSYLAVQMVRNANAGNLTVSWEMTASIDTQNYVQITVGGVNGTIPGGELRFREMVNGVASDVTIGLSAERHKWFRIREKGGKLLWETSIDGGLWNTRRIKASTLDLSAVKANFTAGFWGTEPNPGFVLLDNLNILGQFYPDPGWRVGNNYPLSSLDGGTVVSNNYFFPAQWLWDPIPANPVLDPKSATWAALLSAPGAQHSFNSWDFSTTVIRPGQISASTPRYPLHLLNYGWDRWGDNAMEGWMLPWPAGIRIPGGGIPPQAPGETTPGDPDGHVTIADPALGKVYSLWQAVFDGTNLSASWGSMVDFDGDGREYDGSSTGSQISRYAGVIRAHEIEAGEIPHALFFSTDISAPHPDYRYPANKTDGLNIAGVANPIPEGARVQLDPTIDLSLIPGITPGELAIGRALQIYGGYQGDNGGSRMAFIAEMSDTGTPLYPGDEYAGAGLEWDYFDLWHIPWNKLRVLRNWDGT